MAQGKGILQPHILIDELDNIIGEDSARKKLRDGPFSEILRTAQVMILFLSFFGNSKGVISRGSILLQFRII